MLEEFLEELRGLEESYGLRITVELHDYTLKLVSKYETHRPVAYMNTEFFPDEIDTVEIDFPELQRVQQFLMEEKAENGEEV